MKTLLLLLTTTWLLAGTIQHNFKAVHFNDETLSDVVLVLEDDNYTFSIWHRGVKLSEDFMIVNCSHKANKFCMIKKHNQFYGEIR